MTKKMTTFIAVCLFTTATAFADVRMSIDNFPCQNFRNWLMANGIANADSVITDAKIAEITSIDISVGWMGIGATDLTGIGFFTNLTFLNVGNNQLTWIDVSNLTNLQWLSVSNNQLT